MVIETLEGVPAEWSPFNMRQFNLSVLKPPINKSAGSSSSKISMSYTTATKSLDLLRQNLQKSINQEIKDVISKYIEKFFKPGFENIRNNLGNESVTDDHIQNLCRQILEEAKRMYPSYTASPSPSSCNTSSAIDPNDSDFQNSQNSNQLSQSTPNASEGIKLPHTSPSFGVKRESDTDSEASSMSNASKKLKKSGNKAGGNSMTNNNNTSGNSNASPPKPKKPSGPSRKHVAQWDASKLTSETFFIMGAKANKALGFAQTRGRLYVKHPALFKYASDADDKEWLSKNKLMPATGGRAYIMLLEDIEKLAQDNKLKFDINYDDIKGFRVPEFILEKMKSYINTWKKQYAEEALRTPAPNRNRPTVNNTLSQTPVGGGLGANSGVGNALGSLNPPPLPPPPVHPQQNMSQQSLNSYHLGGNSPVNLYDGSLLPLGSTAHDMADMRDYMQMDKPPPMYPGHSALPQIPNAQGNSYAHSVHLDPIEQAINKGDWLNPSDRSLLQFALQSTRNMGSWDPQDSFDLIESVTNGSLGSSGNLGDNSPLLQISPDAGVHLAAPPIGPVSPNCELSAVLDQAFQYSDT